jgi:hypothetical protein
VRGLLLFSEKQTAVKINAYLAVQRITLHGVLETNRSNRLSTVYARAATRDASSTRTTCRAMELMGMLCVVLSGAAYLTTCICVTFVRDTSLVDLSACARGPSTSLAMQRQTLTRV